MKKIVVMLLLLFLPIPVSAIVIFSENFNTTTWTEDYDFDSDDYSCPNCGEEAWSFVNGDAAQYNTYESVTHYWGEITAPGRAGADDKSLKQWRYEATAVGDVWTLLELYNAGNVLSDAACRDLYSRFYIKIPVGFELADGACNMSYLKLWRYVFGSADGTPIFLNFNGSSFTGASLQIGNAGTVSWITIASVASLQDGDWHCIEYRVKLNTTGSSDGLVQAWIDGEEVSLTGATSLNWGAIDSQSFSKAQLGLGNTGARDCEPAGVYQSEWLAIEFDDYVLADEYIGPTESTPNLIGLKSMNGGTIQ